MVNIPDEILARVQARAEMLDRKIANYLEWLAKEDLRANGAELERFIQQSGVAPIGLEPTNLKVVSEKAPQPASIRKRTLKKLKASEVEAKRAIR